MWSRPGRTFLRPTSTSRKTWRPARRGASSAFGSSVAQCHNHPFSKWTRKQFWEFAAFFGNVQPQFDANLVLVTNISPNGVASLQPAKTPGELTMPGTDKIVKARFLDGTSPVFNANKEARQMLAEWMTSPSNPYFARTGANRLWAHFFGIGIIDPIDDEPSDENPASHPELLNELTAQFVAHQYDVQFLIRAIVSSKAYQRASAATHSSQNEARLFARMAVKGLTPEQLFDNLALATGYQDGTAHQPGVIVPNTPRGEFLLLFTTPDRKTETQTSILQALTMMNGKIVTDATSVTGNHKLAAPAEQLIDKRREDRGALSGHAQPVAALRGSRTHAPAH